MLAIVLPEVAVQESSVHKRKVLVSNLIATVFTIELELFRAVDCSNKKV